METTEANDAGWRAKLRAGGVIPALPLALEADGQWSPRHQRALLRYYHEAGSLGIAVGVHSTQFEIRSPENALFEPILQLSRDVMEAECPEDFVRIAGICGKTPQALAEVELAKAHGFHAGLLSLAAFGDEDEAAALVHARSIAEQLPIIGFYLQPAVGGRVFSYRFWREFAEIPNLVAIKIAPFNRYQTIDVVRAVMDSGREEVALYTGNDDHIIGDLLTPFEWKGRRRYLDGGLLGQWGVWTRAAVELFHRVREARKGPSLSREWLTRNAHLTEANAAVFDATNDFRGCIPGILEVLRRQGLVPSRRCLDPDETLSPGQAEELDRVCELYPELRDDEFVREHLERWLP